MTTYGSASDDIVGVMTILGFFNEDIYRYSHGHIQVTYSYLRKLHFKHWVIHCVFLVGKQWLLRMYLFSSQETGNCYNTNFVVTDRIYIYRSKYLGYK